MSRIAQWISRLRHWWTPAPIPPPPTDKERYDQASSAFAEFLAVCFADEQHAYEVYKREHPEATFAEFLAERHPPLTVK